MNQIRLQQGDSFIMNFVMKKDGKPQYLQNTERIAVGFYNDYGNKYIVKSDNKQIIRDPKNEGHYYAIIPSDITKKFIGDIDVEIVVYDSHDKMVSHADRVLSLFFEERRINSEI